MKVTAPDSRKWTPEATAAYCAEHGLTLNDMAAYARMDEAWRSVEFLAHRRPSAETNALRDAAWKRALDARAAA